MPEVAPVEIEDAATKATRAIREITLRYGLVTAKVNEALSVLKTLTDKVESIKKDTPTTDLLTAINTITGKVTYAITSVKLEVSRLEALSDTIEAILG